MATPLDGAAQRPAAARGAAGTLFLALLEMGPWLRDRVTARSKEATSPAIVVSDAISVFCYKVFAIEIPVAARRYIHTHELHDFACTHVSLVVTDRVYVYA